MYITIQKIFKMLICFFAVKPQVMLVTCMDSRLMPNCYMDTSPGDMFVVRNAGNFIPHAKLFEQDNSSAVMSGIELAVKDCNVEHLVVCGHSNCKVCDCTFQLNEFKIQYSHQG